MIQTVSEWKTEGRDSLVEYKSLLNKNDLNDTEIKRVEYLSKKYGNTVEYKNVKNDNYDRRAMHPGFGSPDCNCHISPPCQSCVDWTNCCYERLEAVERGEPGCLPSQHDCPIGRGEIRA